MFGIQGTPPRSRRASPTEEETMMQIAAQYDERDHVFKIDLNEGPVKLRDFPSDAASILVSILLPVLIVLSFHNSSSAPAC